MSKELLCSNCLKVKKILIKKDAKVSKIIDKTEQKYINKNYDLTADKKHEFEQELLSQEEKISHTFLKNIEKIFNTKEFCCSNCELVRLSIMSKEALFVQNIKKVHKKTINDILNSNANYLRYVFIRNFIEDEKNMERGILLLDKEILTETDQMFINEQFKTALWYTAKKDTNNIKKSILNHYDKLCYDIIKEIEQIIK